MKILLVFVFSLVATLFSFLGEARADIARVYLINPELRYERASSQNLELRSPLNFSVSYQIKRWSALLEYSRFEESSATGNYHIKREHQELMLWARYHLFAWTFAADAHTLQGYLGFGGGGFQESVTTTFQGESRKDSGSNPFMSGAAAGLEYSMRFTEKFIGSASLEGRSLFAADFDPNPTLSAVLRIGIGLIF